MGSLPMRARGLFGKRVAERRAGMRTRGSDMEDARWKLRVLIKAGGVCHGRRLASLRRCGKGDAGVVLRNSDARQGSATTRAAKTPEDPIVKTPSLRLSNAHDRGHPPAPDP